MPVFWGFFKEKYPTTLTFSTLLSSCLSLPSCSLIDMLLCFSFHFSFTLWVHLLCPTVWFWMFDSDRSDVCVEGNNLSNLCRDEKLPPLVFESEDFCFLACLGITPSSAGVLTSPFPPKNPQFIVLRFGVDDILVLWTSIPSANSREGDIKSAVEPGLSGSARLNLLSEKKLNLYIGGVLGGLSTAPPFCSITDVLYCTSSCVCVLLLSGLGWSFSLWSMDCNKTWVSDTEFASAIYTHWKWKVR